MRWAIYAAVVVLPFVAGGAHAHDVASAHIECSVGNQHYDETECRIARLIEDATQVAKENCFATSMHWKENGPAGMNQGYRNIEMTLTLNPPPTCAWGDRSAGAN